MSGRLHHPLETSADPDGAPSAAGPEADQMGPDRSGNEESSREGETISEHAGPPQVGWAAGLPVESAADIAGDAEPGRFTRAHARADGAGDTVTGGHEADRHEDEEYHGGGYDSGGYEDWQAEGGASEPDASAGWSAAPVDSAVVDSAVSDTAHVPPAGVGPVADGWHAGPRADEVAADPQDEADVAPSAGPAAQAVASTPAPESTPTREVATPEPGMEPDAAASAGIRVQLTVWVEAELRRRVTAAHQHIAPDEGYDSLSDYVSSVLDQDVERLERTYNDGATFPGGQTARPQDGTSTYQVRARYGDGLWELRIGDAGVTLSPTLAGAETMARTYVGLLYGVPAEDIHVNVVPELEGGLSEEIAATGRGVSRAQAALEQARAALAAAEEQLSDAREARHTLIERLRATGLSDADTDTVLALTPTD